MAPDLFNTDLSPARAPEGRDEPRLWVRRLAIFEDDTTIRRDVRLKPGLNIIWSPDLSSSGRESLAHGSGKTTFCRLIRACLGEPDFSTESQRQRIINKMQNGFYAAEVIIDGVCWISIRTFGFTETYAVQAESIEVAVKRGKLPGDAASLDPIIRNTFFRDLMGLTPPEIDEEHIWDLLRAWMSRDQECRLADILAWRSTKTQTRSRAQTVSEAAKLAMVRLAIRALDREELEAGVRERKLARDAEEARRRQAFLEEQRKARIEALRAAFGADEVTDLEDALDRKGLVSLAQARLNESMGTVVTLPPQDQSIIEQLQQLNAKRIASLEQKLHFNSEAEMKRKEATHCRSEAELGVAEAAQGSVRVCPICRVPVDEVLASQCKISLHPCNVEAIRKQIAEKREKADGLEREANDADANARKLDDLIARIDYEIREVQERDQNAELARKAAFAAKTKMEDAIYQARRLLDEARDLRDQSLNPPSTETLNRELDRLRLQLEKGRSRASEAISALAEQYRSIIAAWLPDGVEGVIKLDGKGLKVDIEFNDRGEVSTAALDSLKIVAFDLAVLRLATEEKAILPAFLIHDSPREADLDGMLYARLFDLVASWESQQGTPCFQYIVTTTTAPPPNLQGNFFVKLKMSSTPEKERLFKIDL